MLRGIALLGNTFHFGFLDCLEMELNEFYFFCGEADKVLND